MIETLQHILSFYVFGAANGQLLCLLRLSVLLMELVLLAISTVKPPTADVGPLGTPIGRTEVLHPWRPTTLIGRSASLHHESGQP